VAKLKSLSILFCGLLTGLAVNSVNAQTSAPHENPLMKIYRETPPKINDLVRTKLDVHFDYKKRYLYGKEWVTLKPHFYPTDTLRLDAKGMDLKTIALVKNGKNIPLEFRYEDSLSVAIQLDKVYHNTESYTIYIDYTAKPEQLNPKVAAEGTGLYFINPDGTDKEKPVQIWTQGEAESSSCWFPTIDKPEQKTTSEVSITVPAKYVTLSNGRLASQKVNGDGTRTDTWKMDLPNAPYLFTMVVGDFKIYKDKWRDKEISYYLEPKYAPYAKEIFGMTPEIVEFYSKTLGVDFPWNKYSQIVVRDFTGGAMENTTATTHSENIQQTHRELLDAYYNYARSTIAHELFHQWFGDYVTTESWSNITVNESFAAFSETIWAEHKYGKDEGDAHGYADLQRYLNTPGADTKNLVRFHYVQVFDVADAVTYQKGSRILNMLRNYLGEAAFYKGLNIYLKTNAFKNGEAQQLRLAEEQASGRDLTWFFNQWYYGAGHPILNISYKWDNAAKTQTVYLQQTQSGQTFRLPMAIDIYAGGKKERHNVWMNDKADTLTFHVASKPDLVNVDGDKVLLTTKTDNKTPDEFAFQYFNAPLYLDRLEAITFASANKTDERAQKILTAALKDKYYGLQIKAIQAIDFHINNIRPAVPLETLVSLAQTDGNTLVRAAAIKVLGTMEFAGYSSMFKNALSSQSYAVQGAALGALAGLDPAQALSLAKNYESDNKGALSLAILNIYANSGGDEQWPYVYNSFQKNTSQGQFGMINGPFTVMVGRVKNPAYAQQGVTAMKDFGLKFKGFGLAQPVIAALNSIKDQRAKMNDNESVKVIDDAIKQLN
jgi:aminopeptidase N